MTDHTLTPRVYIDTLRGVERGKSIVIAAPGPSLPLHLAEAIHAKHVTIAVTWAMRWPGVHDYWIGMDHGPIQAYTESPTARMPLVLEKFWTTMERSGMAHRLFRPASLRPGTLGNAGEMVVTQGGSLVAAVSAAAVLLGGSGSITLVGADGAPCASTGRHHGSLISGGDPPHSHDENRQQFPVAATVLEALHHELESMGIPHWNATPGSKIPGWPIMDPSELAD